LPNSDNMLTASQARSFLLDFTIDHIRLLTQQAGEPDDDFSIKTIYVGNLCARGDINQIKTFIRKTDPEELREILNCAPEQQWNGTCLNMLLNWNTGVKALEIFELLIEHGAEYSRDGYGFYPWQKLGSLWITPIEHVQLGDRDQDEFEETIVTLHQMYDLEEYEEDDLLLSASNHRCDEAIPYAPVYHGHAHWNSEEAIEVFP